MKAPAVSSVNPPPADRLPAGERPTPRVVISNGLGRFHLAIAAAEIAREGGLVEMITGAYPTRRVASLASALGLERRRKLARMLDRGEDIPEELVSPVWKPEVLTQLGAMARQRGAQRLGDLLNDAALHSFGRGGRRELRSLPCEPQIYHYRSGFGLASVEWAKSRGVVALCDHSIAHPVSLASLTAGSPRLSRPWRTILRDVEQADHVLVNSDFVKSTFLDHGWDPRRVDVIYLGVDDGFLEALPPLRREPVDTGPVRLLFAGTFEARKGADDLVAALGRLPDIPWRLEIAGPLSSESRETHRSFLSDGRVSVLGTLSRTRLAEVMGGNEIFIFPSLAEGSARVVFEALASGLYVITTPTSGSIVRDGIHGAVISPRSPEKLSDAIRRAAADRATVHSVGRSNAGLVRASYRQIHYGQALLRLYERLEAEALPGRAGVSLCAISTGVSG